MTNFSSNLKANVRLGRVRGCWTVLKKSATISPSQNMTGPMPNANAHMLPSAESFQVIDHRAFYAHCNSVSPIRHARRKR